MLSEYVVFVEGPPEFSVEGGLVHIKDRSGSLIFHKVMSVANFRQSIKNANRLADQLGEMRPVSIERARRRKSG